MVAGRRPVGTRGPAMQGAAPSGPRFDLRFESGAGMLRLARPLSVGPVRIVELELSLGPMRFPLDMTNGPARFRTRRTRVRRARIAIDPTGLAEAARKRGVAIAIDAARDGALEATLEDEAGAVAFEVHPCTEGHDLLVHLGAVRSAVDAPATPFRRVLRAARRLGFELDEERGMLRFDRPARRLLAEALCPYGYRVPDERGAEPTDVRVADGAIHLELGLPEDGREEERAERRLARVEASSACAAAIGRLACDDVDGAWDALLAAARRRASRPGGQGPGHDLAGHALASLAATVALDRDASAEDITLVAAGGAADLREVERCAIALRRALRGRDAEEAARAARRLADIDPSDAVAAEALEAVTALVESSSVALDLWMRVTARRPADPERAGRAMDAAERARDGAALLCIARRSLGAVRDEPGRARLAARAALALLGLDPEGQTEARALLEETSELLPEQPDVLAAWADLEARTGAKARAVEWLDRAAAARDARGEEDAASDARVRAAELLVALARGEAAEARLEQAARQGAHPEACAALARVRADLGAHGRADAAWAMLLASDAGAEARVEGYVAAARHYLEEADDAEAARPFIAQLGRRAPDDPRLMPLRLALDRALGRSLARDVDALMHADADLLERLVEATDAPGALADALLEVMQREEAPARLSSTLLAAARRDGESARIARVAALLVEVDRLPRDAEVLAWLADHVTEPALREALRTRAVDARQGQG